MKYDNGYLYETLYKASIIFMYVSHKKNSFSQSFVNICGRMSN